MRPYAVFDFDGTCINGDASETVLEYAYEKRLLTRKQVDTVYETEKYDYRAAAILCAELIVPFDNDFIADALTASTLTLRPEIAEYMQLLSDCDIWIVSASSVRVLDAALPYFDLNLPFIGLDLNEEPYPIDEGKVECIKAHIHATERPLFAAGDSVHDFPMLEYAEGAYLVL